MGNRISGNGNVRIRETLLDLRFKVYHVIANSIFLNTIFFERNEDICYLKEKIDKPKQKKKSEV